HELISGMHRNALELQSVEWRRVESYPSRSLVAAGTPFPDASVVAHINVSRRIGKARVRVRMWAVIVSRDRGSGGWIWSKRPPAVSRFFHTIRTSAAGIPAQIEFVGIIWIN